MSQCNFCTMKDIKRSRKKGERIIKRVAPIEQLGGVNVYIKPTGVELDHDKHFKAWFMELPDYCAC